MTYWLIALAVFGVVLGLGWRLIAIGCEEPLCVQKRKAWWNQ